MIEARGIKKAYAGAGSSPVLEGLDLSVDGGEFVAILGPSGSGKSTLLHILGGLDVDYGGDVTVADTHLRSLKDAALARFRNAEVGFVFQSFHLIPQLNALENVRLPAFFSQKAELGRTADERAATVLARVGLGDKRARRPSELSGGERQRVAIARALFHAPKLLLCDEPTGNLDERTGAEVIELFSSLHREGLTLVTVTHEARMSTAAKRVLRLSEGKLVPAGAEAGAR